MGKKNKITFEHDLKLRAIELRADKNIPIGSIPDRLAAEFPGHKNNRPRLRSIRKWVANKPQKPKTKTDPYIEIKEKLYKESIKVETRSLENRELKKEIKFLRKRASLNDAVIEQFSKIQIPRAAVPMKKLVTRGTKQALIALSSDEHITALVAHERMHGINEYDMCLARRRMLYWAETIAKYINHYWQSKNITHLIDANLGDKFQGTIHDAEITNEAEQTQGIELWLRTKADCYDLLLKLCPQLTITSLHLSGNHTRRSSKPDVNRPLSHDDALSGMVLKVLYRNEPRIKFLIPNAYWFPLVILNHIYIFTHGQFVRSWAGIPFYGILRHYKAHTQLLEKTDMHKALMIEKMKELLEKNKNDPLLSQYPDTEKNWVQGHFHVPCKGLGTELGNVFMNGSLIGPEEYGMSLAVATRPEQLLIATHPEHGHTDVTGIRLSHIKHDKEVRPQDVLAPITIST